MIKETIFCFVEDTDWRSTDFSSGNRNSRYLFAAADLQPHLKKLSGHACQSVGIPDFLIGEGDLNELENNEQPEGEWSTAG